MRTTALYGELQCDDFPICESHSQGPVRVHCSGFSRKVCTHANLPCNIIPMPAGPLYGVGGIVGRESVNAPAAPASQQCPVRKGCESVGVLRTLAILPKLLPGGC